MKQKLYTLGLIVALITFAGAIFKVNHLPGAGILLTVGLLSLVLIFLPAALINHYKSSESEKNMILYIVTWITTFVIFISMLFKIMHWPHAGLLLLIALPFPYVVFLPVFLAVTSKNKSFNIYNTVFVLLLLALNSVFAGLLALSPALTRINDSYNISRDYNRSSAVITASLTDTEITPVNSKIEEVIGIIDSTEAAILKFRHTEPVEWIRNAGELSHPDERINPEMTVSEDESLPGIMLAMNLRELINIINQTPGYEDLASNIAAITDFNVPSGQEDRWVKETFSGKTISWALIYLDGLRANLLMIRAVRPAGLKDMT